MGKGGAPASPDYTAAAKAQSQGNKELAMLTTAMNRTGTEGPQGSTGWSLRPGADPNNPQAGDWTQTTTLAPSTQQAYDSGISGANAQLAGMAGGRDAITNAMYNRETQFYGDRFGRDEASLRDRLTNSGLTEGSEAWKNAMTDFNRSKNEAYGTASNNAVLAGSQEESAAASRYAQLLSAAKGILPSSQVAQMGQVQGPDYLSAAQAQGKDSMAKWAQDQQSTNQGLSSAANLAMLFALLP